MYANGDARVALNLLELSVAAAPTRDGVRHIDSTRVQETIQRRALLYDKTGEEHYNLISALHKSMRNSDPDAAVYWLARMVEAGEDPLYIARRLVRFASEDIGNADPQALTVPWPPRTPCISSGCPKGTRPWLKRPSTWPRHPRATRSTRRTTARPKTPTTTWRSPCRCTCATPRRS